VRKVLFKLIGNIFSALKEHFFSPEGIFLVHKKTAYEGLVLKERGGFRRGWAQMGPFRKRALVS
jgi:hypothetical protein